MTNEYLENIYKQYYKQLFLFALSLTHNKADAEDLVANTFVKAFLSYHGGYLKAWLYVVLKNEFLNMRKKESQYIDEGKININNIQYDENTLKDLIVEEEKQWLFQKIYSLKRNEREVLLLSLQNDLSDQMISQILNLSIDNVRVIKYRAKKKIMNIYEEEKSNERKRTR